MKTQKLGPFLGVNNRLPDSALLVDAKTGARYVKSALNVELDNAFRFRRRLGESLVQAMTGAHSLHLTNDTGGYLVRDSVLYAITLPTYAETLFKVLTVDDRISWCSIGPDLFYSNGTDSGRITAGVWYPLGLPTPDAPVLSSIGGALDAGLYRVAVAYVNATTGEEGGISSATSIDITAVGGIRLLLPMPMTGASHVNVYLSATNGEVLYLAATVSAGTATADLIAHATGRESSMRFEEPLPAGTLFESNGRLCSYAGSVVYVGLPYRYGYYLLADGYIPFNSTVTMAITNQGGTYIAADQTFWIPGDIGDVQGSLIDVLPYGAVPGTSFTFPDNTLVGWFGAKGIVFGSPSGEVQDTMGEAIDLTAPESGMSIVLEDRGYTRVLSCGWCLNLENKVPTSTDISFTSASRGYATKADGLYRIDGESLPAWSIDFGKIDFGTAEKKHLPNAYLGLASDEEVYLKVVSPGQGEFDYPTRSYSEDLEIQRVDVGKGLRANWFGLSLFSDTGTDFTLASIDFNPVASNRRI